jgi:diguanylate cyclase (GGDEF)-like protein
VNIALPTRIKNDLGENLPDIFTVMAKSSDYDDLNLPFLVMAIACSFSFLCSKLYDSSIAITYVNLSKSSMMRKLPQRKYLFLGLSTILVTGFLTTSVLSYWVSTKSIRESITDQALPLTGDNVYSSIQKDIVRPIFISSQMAGNTFLRDWIISGEKDQVQLTRYLKSIKKEHSTITSFLISEKTRRYYYADGVLKTISQNDPRDKWFFRVRALKERFETNVDPDLANQNTTTIFINYRMLDDQGRFLGVTGVGLTLDNMKHIVETYEKKFKRRIYFVDKKGNIRLSSDSIPASSKSINQMSGISKISDKILAGSTNPLSLSYNLSDDPNSIIYLNSRYIPELSWYLLVEQNEEDAIKPLRIVLFINLFVSALVTALILSLILPTLHLYQGRLEKIATTDALTGLMNRLTFDFLICEYLKDTARKKINFSTVMFDIDHFKKINDRHGHLAGDKVIKGVAAIAKCSIRSNDLLARWGGEEFIILLKDCKLEEAKQVAEKIRSAIEKFNFELELNHSRVTVSIGVASYQHPETAESFFSRTDGALYQAKNQGRNCVVAV